MSPLDVGGRTDGTSWGVGWNGLPRRHDNDGVAWIMLYVRRWEGGGHLSSANSPRRWYGGWDDGDGE